MFETLIGLLGGAARSLGESRHAGGGAAPMTTATELHASDDDLPPEARALIAEAETAARTVRETLVTRGDRVRAAAEDEARAIRRRAEDEVRDLEIAATRELAPTLHGLFDGLRAVQESYTKLGKLDEALAVRANLRHLRADLLGIRPDPGHLSDLSTDADGRTFLYEVVGRAPVAAEQVRRTAESRHAAHRPVAEAGLVGRWPGGGLAHVSHLGCGRRAPSPLTRN